ncbi:MAG: hypothetical protein K5790_10565 [Nitrosopumilus sp.]|uniref:hypothetical protein n=1 Tax=Nitrosopumilus sp. TaxID=2024843 RepID=UPI00247E5178|nr:hypothetical protein [Nitrosopumilus sp.]MCV0393713.1 hypothetical protein [Nitrosopumilus sp.]
MSKLTYFVVGTVTISVLVSLISIGLVMDANQKFENVNTNFQNMKEMFFQNQLGNQQYNCIQDFEIRNALDVGITDSMNQRSECLMKIDVSKKIYQYQEFGIEPVFNDKEIRYIETILTQTNVPIFEQMLQFRPSLPIEEPDLPTIGNLTISSPDSEE